MIIFFCYLARSNIYTSGNANLAYFDPANGSEIDTVTLKPLKHGIATERFLSRQTQAQQSSSDEYSCPYSQDAGVLVVHIRTVHDQPGGSCALGNWSILASWSQIPLNMNPLWNRPHYVLACTLPSHLLIRAFLAPEKVSVDKQNARKSAESSFWC